MRSHALRNAIEEWQQLPSQQRQPAPTHQLPLPHRPADSSPTMRTSGGGCPSSLASLHNGTGGGGGLKLILLGDSGVGKTSLVQRVKEGTFCATAPTIGCSFCMHTVVLPRGHGLGLAIWDTAGQEKYRSFTRQYFRGSSAVVVVFDITSSASFAGAQRWVQEAQLELTTPPPVMTLVGTKSDLGERRQVSVDMAREYAAQQGLAFLECSAKDGSNVDRLFVEVAQQLLERGFVRGETVMQGAVASGSRQSVTLPTPRLASSMSGGCC